MQHVLFYNFKQFFSSSSSGNTVFHLWPLLCFSYYPLHIEREEKQTFIKVQEKQTNHANPKLISWFLWLQLAVRKRGLCFHLSHEFPGKICWCQFKKCRCFNFWVPSFTYLQQIQSKPMNASRRNTVIQILRTVKNHVTMQFSLKKLSPTISLFWGCYCLPYF